MKSLPILNLPDQFVSPLVTSRPTSSGWRNEQLVWSAFRLGNRAAFKYLCSNYIRPLVEYGSRFTKDVRVVDDCVETLFLDLWRKKEIVYDVLNIKVYLFKALRRKLSKTLTPPSTRFLGNSEDLEFSHDFAAAHPDIPVVKKLHIKGGLSQLTNHQREALFLKFMQQLSYDEIAELLDLSIHSTTVLIGNAIHSLRKHVAFHVLPY